MKTLFVLLFIGEKMRKEAYEPNILCDKANRFAFKHCPVQGDGDCGYTAFGIARANAYNLISNELFRVRELLLPLIKEMLLDKNFISYLLARDTTPNSLASAFNCYKAASEGGGRMDNAITENLFLHANDLIVIQGYIDYDIRDKNVDAGWPHPRVLQALAHLQEVELYIWQLENGGLIPHLQEEFAVYRPEKATQRADLLFINNNHFDRLMPCILTNDDLNEHQPLLSFDISKKAQGQRKKSVIAAKDDTSACFIRADQMLDQLIKQIQEYESLGQKDTAFEVIGIVITRLYQVDKPQIQNIPALTLRALFLVLQNYKADNAKAQSMLVTCEQALAIVECYRSNYPNELVDTAVQIGNVIGDLRRRTRHQLINKTQSIPTRIETQDFDQELVSLKHFCRGLETLENTKQAPDQVEAQRNKIAEAMRCFYRKQSQYWHEKWRVEIHGKIHDGIRHGEEKFPAAHRELEDIVNKLLSVGLYDQARLFLAYQGLPSQVPNRAGDYALNDLLTPITTLNEKHLGVLKDKKPALGMWQEYRQQLSEIRSQIRGTNVRAEQKSLVETYLRILRSMFDHASCVLGPAPKRFCLIVYGSLSRGDVTTNSDVEAGAIVEDIADRATLEYLQNFIQLWRYEMEALGESDATRAGFHFDVGGVSIDINSSVNTNFVFDIKSYVREAINNFGDDNTQLRPLFIYGDQSLFDESQKALPKLTEAQLEPVLSRTAKLLNGDGLSTSLAVSAAASASSDIPSISYLKEKYLHPMIWAITQLGLYHGLPQEHSSHPLDILEWLGQQEILDLAFIRNCQQKLTYLYQQRLLNFSPLASSSSKTLCALDNNDLKEIEAIVLKPWGLLLGWMSQSRPKWLGKRIHPGYYPEANGLRYLTQREEAFWREQVTRNYVASEPTSGLPQIKIKTMQCGEGYLHGQVIRQLQRDEWINARGEFNLEMKINSKTKGRHLVIPLILPGISLYIKVFPEMPGIEYAASQLSRLIIGHGLPLVEICRFEVDQKIYSIILSQAIPGDSLDIVLKIDETAEKGDTKEKKEAEEIKLDPRSFSEMMLLNLILSPEDGKPDNFILTNRKDRIADSSRPLLSLVNVDNDRSFYPAVIEESENKFTVMVKTVVYCFDEMQEKFDESLANELMVLDPYQVLQEWLRQLAKAEEALARLFSLKEMKVLYEEQYVSSMMKWFGMKQDLLETSMIPIVLREKLISELYVLLIRLKSKLTESREITHFEVLQHLQPWLGKWYGDLFKGHQNTIKRFNAGPGLLYGKGNKDFYVTQQTLPQTLKTLHGKPMKMDAYLQSQQQMINQVIAELIRIKSQYQTLQQFSDKITAGNEQGITELQNLLLDELKERVIGQLDFSKVLTPFGKLFSAMETISYRNLRLINCNVLDVDHLKRMLHRTLYLYELTLRGAPNINTLFWGLLIKKSKALEKLHFDGLPALAWPEEKYKIVVLDRLRECSISNCKAIKTIALVAASLDKFELIKCDSVVKIEIDAPNMQIFTIKDVPQWQRLSLNTTKLQLLKIKRCSRIIASELENVTDQQGINDYKLIVKECMKISQQDELLKFASSSTLFAQAKIHQKVTAISKTQLATKAVNPAEINALLKWITEGHLEKVEKLLKKNPILTLTQGTVTDLSGRTFESITAFQLAVWYLDDEMWEIILKYLDKAQAALQLESLGNDRKDISRKYGLLFNFDSLLQAYQTYIDNYDKWTREQRNEHWCKKVGGEQSMVPAWHIYMFCERGTEVAWVMQNFAKKVTRDYGEQYGTTWFRSTIGGFVVGKDFAYARGWGRTHRRHWATLLGEPGAAHDFVSLQRLRSRQAEQLSKLQASLSDSLGGEQSMLSSAVLLPDASETLQSVSSITEKKASPEETEVTSQHLFLQPISSFSFSSSNSPETSSRLAANRGKQSAFFISGTRVSLDRPQESEVYSSNAASSQSSEDHQSRRPWSLSSLK